MPSDFLQALIDPTAPLPAGWPSGAWGAFLLFMVPVGGGIPLGVIMASKAGVLPPVIAFMYLVSDVVLAITTEPMLVVLRWLGRVIPPLGRIGQRLGRLTGQAGLKDSGARGPLGLILVAFSVSPTTGRAAAAAAGHGFFSGWTFAIIGDMGYFVLLMVSTLWLTDVFGDERFSVGAVLALTWLLPVFIRRLRGARSVAARTTLSPVPALAYDAESAPEQFSIAAPRPSHNSRRQRLKGRRG